MKLQPWLTANWVLQRPGRLPPLILLHPSCIRKFSASTTYPYRSLDALEDAHVKTFQQQCFSPEQPGLLPRFHFHDLPALKNWFQSPSPTAVTRLNDDYLRTHAADPFVPLELTEKVVQTPSTNGTASEPNATEAVSFRQFHAPLTLFLDWMRMAETSPQSARLYLAQCQLMDLPPVLRDDFPTPQIVVQAGKGDVYDTNVWIGHPPTYTPLHRDPNPNLFVQLAGQKVVRLLAPSEGQVLFSAVRRELGQSGGKEAAAFRGEEMMQGQERALLDKMVWGVSGSAGSESGHRYEVHLEAGDGLFIPKGWWHSIKGIGEGVTASNIGDENRSRKFQNRLGSTRHFILLEPPPPPSTLPKSIMLLSRTAYRAALLHLTVNPLLARAAIPSASTLKITSHVPTSSSRLYNVLFPQCSPLNALEQSRQAHTMSSSNTEAPKQDPAQSQSEDQVSPPSEQLYLPSSESGDQPQRLDLSAGSTVSLDHLGPMVVNVDGTLARIGNWEQMTDIERKNTLRILGKRNKQRLAALKAAEAEKEQK
ncbi:hypothetical protein N7486_010185 [Penicillium sp. IBT 16267x]|nr:hypothetical protein N7486_010185 [Penicillium sp. IBT 16267x]